MLTNYNSTLMRLSLETVTRKDGLFAFFRRLRQKAQSAERLLRVQPRHSKDKVFTKSWYTESVTCFVLVLKCLLFLICCSDFLLNAVVNKLDIRIRLKSNDFFINIFVNLVERVFLTVCVFSRIIFDMDIFD